MPGKFRETKLALEMIDSGEVVEFSLDDGEPIKNVPRSLEVEGHTLLGLEEKGGVFRPDSGSGARKQGAVRLGSVSLEGTVRMVKKWELMECKRYCAE